jgi:Ser/Thr protein kinase RdoA (MazF antagonist)
VIALEPWGLEVLAAERAPSGLIHETWFVDTPGGRLVAQRLHPIFGAPVLEDTEAVTAHLAARGVPTPRLVRTRAGALGARDDQGRLWRVATYLDGWTVDRVAGPAMARAAAGVVARFHGALADLDWDYRFVRPGVHDTAAWIARLASHAGDALADAILEHGARLDLAAFARLPRRHAHGDLKISNVLFTDPTEAVALLDLDTLGRMPLAFELGDAWRSWCNPLGEDVEETRFDLEIFAAAVQGYVAGATLEPDDAASLVPGLETIAVELAARFCVDTFEDRYFGWDPRRFPSRREHNRVRATGQLALARAVASARRDAEEIVTRAPRR